MKILCKILVGELLGHRMFCHKRHVYLINNKGGSSPKRNIMKDQSFNKSLKKKKKCSS